MAACLRLTPPSYQPLRRYIIQSFVARDKKWESYWEYGLLDKKILLVAAAIIDFFLVPTPLFESKKKGGICQYSEPEICIILATIVTIFFLIQKGEWGLKKSQ